jgi:hypothetical protein
MKRLSTPFRSPLAAFAASRKVRDFFRSWEAETSNLSTNVWRCIAFVEKARASVAAALACLARIVHRPALPDAALFGGIRT